MWGRERTTLDMVHQGPPILLFEKRSPRQTRVAALKPLGIHLAVPPSARKRTAQSFPGMCWG